MAVPYTVYSSSIEAFLHCEQQAGGMRSHQNHDMGTAPKLIATHLSFALVFDPLSLATFPPKT